VLAWILRRRKKYLMLVNKKLWKVWDEVMVTDLTRYLILSQLYRASCYYQTLIYQLMHNTVALKEY